MELLFKRYKGEDTRARNTEKRNAINEFKKIMVVKYKVALWLLQDCAFSILFPVRNSCVLVPCFLTLVLLLLYMAFQP